MLTVCGAIGRLCLFSIFLGYIVKLATHAACFNTKITHNITNFMHFLPDELIVEDKQKHTENLSARRVDLKPNFGRGFVGVVGFWPHPLSFKAATQSKAHKIAPFHGMLFFKENKDQDNWMGRRFRQGNHAYSPLNRAHFYPKEIHNHLHSKCAQ